MIRRALLVTVLGAAACLGPRTDPATYYVLSPGQGDAGEPLPIQLGVGPVTVPGYLARSELVTRVSENRLSVSETERWAEPLEEGVARALSAGLRRRLGPDRVVPYPWYASDGIDYGVSVEITRFEASSPSTVVLAATWRVEDGEGGEALEGDDSVIEVATDGPTGDASVAALSGALDALAAEIAGAVRRAHAGG